VTLASIVQIACENAHEATAKPAAANVQPPKATGSGAVSSIRIEPELREFIDEVLVPMLVRDALREICDENRVAPGRPVVAESHCSQEIQ
jgi:hypothetical protein